MARMKLNCCVCEKPESFVDEYDIKQMKWQIIAWIVHENLPRVVCNKCDYPPKELEKTKKSKK